jgi:hypothetical protein
MPAAARKKTKTAAKAQKKPAPVKSAKKPVAKTPSAKHPAPARPAEKGKAASVPPPARAAEVKGAVARPAGAAHPAPAAVPANQVKGAGAAAPAPSKPASGRPSSGKKSTRKSSLANRRGPNGEPFVPGDLLLPHGPQGPDEIQYLLRGSVAAEHAAAAAAVSEIILKKGTPEAEADREDLSRYAEGMNDRFEKGAIEPLLPTRGASKRNFAGVVERAKHRRREIGAFLRGLDLGRTETSHMDSHGEASLQSLMEWAARLENLAEADEPDQADYAQFHRGLDQLENTTETLIVDVELTLRRLRDRVRS